MRRLGRHTKERKKMIYNKSIVLKKLNRLMSDTSTILKDTVNTCVPGNKHIWNECVPLQRRIIELFQEIQDVCSDVLDKRN